MLRMPVTDILVWDFGMMGQAHCTVGLMSKCLQSSTALQTILTKILNHFYRPPDQYFTKFGIYKIYTHCTYYYLHWNCHQIMQLVSSSSANRASDSHLLKLTGI